MAAFCACCGAEITEKAEACVVCGTPRHGMVRADAVPLGPGDGAEIGETKSWDSPETSLHRE